MSIIRASAQLSKLACRTAKSDSEIRFAVIRTIQSMSRQRIATRSILLPTRLLSSESAKPAAATDPAANEKPTEEKQRMIATQKYDEDGYADDTETSSHWASYAMLGAGAIFFGLIAYYLWPRRMGANSVFSSAFEVVRVNDEILAITGDPMKAFGRDVGRNTEGRRNFVDSRTYVDANDGSNRTRVRFNVKGPKGQALVWAEVSDKLPDNQYVYLICQDKRTGRVVTVEDNRDRMDSLIAQQAEAGQSALAALSGLFKK